MTADRVLCPEPHDYGPPTTPEWIAWAAARSAYEVHQCPDCRLLVVWRPKTQPQPEPEQQALL